MTRARNPGVRAVYGSCRAIAICTLAIRSLLRGSIWIPPKNDLSYPGVIKLRSKRYLNYNIIVEFFLNELTWVTKFT